MSEFEYDRKIPSCLITKDLLIILETYLKVEMCQKFREVLGDEYDFTISIKEKIGTETFGSINEYAPTIFSDGTKAIKINWNNRFKSKRASLVDITIKLNGDYYLSDIEIACSGSTAREIANGIGNAILRLLDSHRTYNYVFNPFKFPIFSIISGVLICSMIGFEGGLLLITKKLNDQAVYLLLAATFVGWFFISGAYFRPNISFDTRRQQLLDRVWRYFSLGIFAFIFFGTLLPLLRKHFVGF